MKKLSKIKKLLILAIIPTTILFNASFAFADTTMDKLQLMFDQVKNNPEFQDGQLYINAKFITKSGLVLQWNSETGSFVVGGGDDNIIPPTTTPIVDEPVINPTEPIQNIIIDNNKEVTETTFNGLNAIIVDGETYFSAGSYKYNIRLKNNNNDILWDLNSNPRKHIIHIEEKQDIIIPLINGNALYYNRITHKLDKDAFLYYNIKFYQEY